MDVTAARTITTGLKRSHSTIAENRLFKYERLSKRTTKATGIRARDYFLHERSFSNVKILVDEQIVWCDKASLAAASPVLREVLLKKSNDTEMLSFDDIALDEFLSMLEFIYPLFNPEINEENIASLIRLADRFQFDVLEQACQFYVTKYLNTIRHVFAKCQPFPVEGVCCVEQTGEHLSYSDRDLIEFQDGTCVDAVETTTQLCQWLKTYFHGNHLTMIQDITSILEQVSMASLEQALTVTGVNESIKAFIYRSRAQYLEEMHQTKRIA